MPRTLLTNDAAQAREFAERLDGSMIYKPLSAPSVRIGGELRLIYATRVDLRLTVVGNRFFAVAIHASSDEARADWRSDYGALSYEPVEIPDGLRFSIIDLLKQLDLPFGF